jgi:peptidoglycan hydrolase-like protein with peptidoglycan-binding domain
MFDSAFNNQFPPVAEAVAGYVDGHVGDQPNAAWLKAHYPHAHVLTIANSAAHDADALDIEQGDATPAQAVAWYDRQRGNGAARPCLYASASVMQADILPVLRGAAIPRPSVRLWSAHYGQGSHICGPASCGLTSISMDGTQFDDHALGRDLDQSLLADGFFGTPPSPVPAWQEAIMNTLPTLKQGAKDTPGHVYYVSRMQALIKVLGEINNLAVAACQETSGTFDAATTAALKQVQGHFGLTADGICGPKSWSVLVTGSAT